MIDHLALIQSGIKYLMIVENTQRITVREITKQCINQNTEYAYQNCNRGGLNIIKNLCDIFIVKWYNLF